MSRRRFTLVGLLALLLSVVGATAVASPAQASRSPNLPIIIFSGHVYNGASTRCLDSGVVANAQLWTCSSSSNQYWTYRAGHGAQPLGCLDEGAGVNGSGVFVTSCNFSNHQKWYYFGGGGPIVNAASGRCLDADLGTIGNNGTKVQVWDCNGGANQFWEFENEP